MRTSLAILAVALLATTLAPAASADIFVEGEVDGRTFGYNDPMNCPLRITPDTIGPATYGADGINCGVIIVV